MTILGQKYNSVSSRKSEVKTLFRRVFVLVFSVGLIASPGKAQTAAQTIFRTPEEAASALQQALKAQDKEKLLQIFGGNAEEELSSGDPVSDHNDREVIALAMDQTWRWVPKGALSKQLIIGDEGWPFPIPLTKRGAGWQFDTEAGKEEVLARRIGQNELSVIDLCRAYPEFQEEYASRPHDGNPAGLYAQKIRSSPGMHDGLFWDAKIDEPQSPLGDLLAQAAAEGYTREKSPAAPFRGYNFRILTAQGGSARGGAENYIMNGKMPGGYALLAYPARYGYSGVMTFIVNREGVVYEKDLGSETSKVAADIKEYNPDKTWKAVRQ